MNFRPLLFLIILIPAASALSAQSKQSGIPRKITLPLGNHVGFIQWIKVTPYQGLKDSSGAIVKGTPLLNRTESWAYDEYGDEIENCKYGATGNSTFNRITHAYYPNGDVEEIRDSSERTGVKQLMDHRERPAGRHAPQTTYSFTYISETLFDNHYDASGNLLSSAARYYDNVNQSYSASYHYSEGCPGPMVLKNGSSYMNKYVYDSYGNMVGEEEFYSDTSNPITTTLYHYNENGQMTEKDESGGQRSVFNRDMKGRVIDEATYFRPNGLIRDIKTTYNNTGDTLEIVEKDSPGGDHSPVERTYVKRFIKKTNTVQEGYYDSQGGLTDSIVSHFDLKKHLLDMKQFHTSCISTGKRKTIMMEHLVNDKHFNMIVDDKFNFDGKVEYKNIYQYKYDSVGNWVEQVWLTNDKPVQITEREIRYFTGKP